jgi:hypothetical protein
MAEPVDSIELLGNPNEVDSFATCLTAAITRWGRQFDYSYVAGLTGSVFSPVLAEDESCSAWWMEFGNDNRMELLGKALGFAYRGSPEVSREEFEAAGRLPELNERFWNSAREAHANGRIVLIGTWPCWSIVTSWSGDLHQPDVASLKGFGGLCKPHPTSKLYILSDVPARMTRVEAIREALRFGADLADGTFTRPGFSYGGKLYGAVLDRLDQDCFCADCREKSFNCAVRTMKRVRATNSTAVEFLTHAGEFLGKQIPQRALAAVMKGYQTIADLAEAYIDNEAVHARWADEAFQARFRSDVERMRETHVQTARLLRNLVDHLSG